MRKKAQKKNEQPAIKPLGDEFISSGFLLTILQREGDIAIAKKERIKKPWCDHYEAGYEVAIVKRHNGYSVGGVFIAPAETWPGASSFGLYGWAFMELHNAERKFFELVQKQKNHALLLADEEEESSGDE